MAIVQNLMIGALATAGAQAARNLPESSTGVINTLKPSLGGMLATYVAGRLYDPAGKMGTVVASAVTGAATGLTTTAVSTNGSRGDVKQWVSGVAAGTLANWFVEHYVNA